MTTVRASARSSRMRADVPPGGVTPPVRGDVRRAVMRITKGGAGVLAAIGIWEALRALSVLPAGNAPSAWSILTTAVRELARGPLATAATQTAYAWGVGFLVAVAVGVSLGVLVGLSRWADAATGVLFDFLRPIPAVALVPVSIVLLGLGLRMQTFLTVFAAVWPMLFNTRYGVRNVDPLLIDSARAQGVGGMGLVRRVVLPAALPSIFTGLRLSASTAVVVTVVTEIVASGTGLGHYIDQYQQVGHAPEAFAGVLVAGVFGYLVNVVMLAADRWAVRWRALTVGGDQ
jgi:ABC-type nitrate/sulfonate/bicarbonate transport system permease component